jgi:hypothetical protein
MMSHENPNYEVQCNQDCGHEKKPWNAPQLTAVSISGMTGFGASPGGDDGVHSPSTLS